MFVLIIISKNKQNEFKKFKLRVVENYHTIISLQLNKILIN